MSIKRASELFASASPLIVGFWRVAVLLCLLAMFFLRTVFATKEEIASTYGKLPAVVEQLTKIADAQQRANERTETLNIPNRIVNLERVSEEARGINAAQTTALNATDKQLAVIATQLADISRQVGESNRRLEKIADKIGTP